MIIKSLLFSFLVGSSAQASTFIGNGGDAVTCKAVNGQITTQLFDYFEAYQLNGREVQFPNDTVSVDQKIEILLSRIESVSPLRAAMYREWSKKFIGDALFLTATDLTPIHDVDNVSMPKGCALEQVAVQVTPELPGDHRYIIAQDLWNKLDTTSQAGLILHELIYRELITYGHSNSVDVRKFNSFIAADQQTLLADQQSIAGFFQALHFAVSDFNHYNLELLKCSGEEQNSRAFCKDGSAAQPSEIGFDHGALVYGWLVVNQRLPLVDQIAGLALQIHQDDHQFARFYRSGRIKSVPDGLYDWLQASGGNVEISDVLFYDLPNSPIHCLSRLYGDLNLKSSSGAEISSTSNVIYELTPASEVLGNWEVAPLQSPCSLPL